MATYKILNHLGEEVQTGLTQEQGDSYISAGHVDGFSYYRWDTSLLEDWASEGVDNHIHDRIIQQIEE